MQQAKPAGSWPCGGITQPLLLVNGELDKLVSKPGLDDDGLDVHERPFYPRSSAFTARAISGAAHDLALDPRADGAATI